MTKPNSKPESAIIRYEAYLYRNATTTKATQEGFERGKKYATSQPNLRLETLVNVTDHMTIPQRFREKHAYKLAFVLGYLKQLNLYNPEDQEQQTRLDALKI